MMMEDAGQDSGKGNHLRISLTPPVVWQSRQRIIGAQTVIGNQLN